MTSPAPDVSPSIGLITHMIQSLISLKGVPIAFSTQLEFLKGNREFITLPVPLSCSCVPERGDKGRGATPNYQASIISPLGWSLVPAHTTGSGSWMSRGADSDFGVNYHLYAGTVNMQPSGPSFMVGSGFVTMAGGVKGSLGSGSVAGTGSVVDVRKGGEGLGKSFKADGVSVVTTSGTRWTGVGWSLSATPHIHHSII